MSREARILFIVTYILVGFGIVMIYSSTAVLSSHRYGFPQYFLMKQSLFALVGTIAFFITAGTPIRFYKKHSRALMLVSILLLFFVFLPVFGHAAGGAKRWIRLPGFQFQPVEFAKIACCIYLADYLARKMSFIGKGQISIFLPPLILIGIISVLTLLQPDLGSVAFLLFITAIIFFVVGLRMRYVFGATLVFMPIFYFLIVRVPYRLSRLQAYLNPWDDPQGSGFQIIQSFLAFALGGVHGVGLGKGAQKLFYLPSSHNDFILSIIGEELGLIGVLFVVLCYVVFFVCGLKIANRSEKVFERLLGIGATLLIVLQALIHMMVATGLVPTKGLPLPLVSYGGSSLVASLMAVGILIAIDKKQNWNKA